MTIDELHALWYSKNKPKTQIKGKASSSEHTLQVECVRWFRLQYPKYDKLLMAIPNGGKRDVRVARKLKDEGTIAGVPDLFLAVPTSKHAGLWIEMKNGSAGRVSDAQQQQLLLLSHMGYEVAVCRTFDEFRDKVQEYLS